MMNTEALIRAHVSDPEPFLMALRSNTPTTLQCEGARVFFTYTDILILPGEQPLLPIIETRECFADSPEGAMAICNSYGREAFAA